jgi:DmsE family decaheme c-type cytochrome
MSRVTRRSVPIAAVLGLAAVGIFLVTAGEAPSAPAPIPSYQQAEPPEYVGSDLCQECHTEQSDKFMSNLHAGIDWDTIDWPYEIEEGVDIGCESCHGPGMEHVILAGSEEPGFREAIISFANVSATVGSAQCLTCHASKPTHQDFFGSSHESFDVQCADCHDGHASMAVTSMLDKPDPQVCYDCHGDQRGMFALPERHPVNQGLMTCSDCHSPHGTPNRLNLMSPGNETCTDCHQEKRGPFVFAHPPAETDGCASCHQPHGSVNKHMLNFQSTALNCLQCHAAQPSFHQQPGFSECTACHLSIHGSNLDPYFLR